MHFSHQLLLTYATHAQQAAGCGPIPGYTRMLDRPPDQNCAVLPAANMPAADDDIHACQTKISAGPTADNTSYLNYP